MPLILHHFSGPTITGFMLISPWGYKYTVRYLDKKIREITEMLDNFQTNNDADIVYDNVLSKNGAQDIVDHLGLTGCNIIVFMSLYGAQLYQNKILDT